MSSFSELRGKIIGVTQYGSGGLFSARRCANLVSKNLEVTILQMGGTPGVAEGLRRGRIEVGVPATQAAAGFPRPGQADERRERARDGLSWHRRAAHNHRAQDQGRPSSRSTFHEAYLETVHYFQTNKAGTSRILKKYMGGTSEEHISLWCDELRAGIKPVPDADEEALRAELEMMNVPGNEIPPAISTTVSSMS